MDAFAAGLLDIGISLLGSLDWRASVQILGLQVVSMYAVFHPGFVMQRWHVFVAYLIAN